MSFLASSLDTPDCENDLISSCRIPYLSLKSDSLIWRIAFSASLWAFFILFSDNVDVNSSIKSF